MVKLLNKTEVGEFKKKFPNAKIPKTCLKKRKSNRGSYYVEESSKYLKALAKMRNCSIADVINTI